MSFVELRISEFAINELLIGVKVNQNSNFPVGMLESNNEVPNSRVCRKYKRKLEKLKNIDYLTKISVLQRCELGNLSTPKAPPQNYEKLSNHQNVIEIVDNTSLKRELDIKLEYFKINW